MKKYLILTIAFLFLLTGFATAQNTSNVPQYKFGFIDKTGKFVIKPRFDSTRPFSEGLAAVEINDRWGYIDHSGKFVIQPQFVEAKPFAEGLAAVSLGGGMGWNYIDRTGNFLIYPEFAKLIIDAHSYSDGLAWVTLPAKKPIGKMYILLDKRGNNVAFQRKVFGLIFEEVRDFHEGMSLIKYGLWSYIAKTGDGMIVLPEKIDLEPYSGFGDFSEGMAVIEIDGKYGFIDREYDYKKNNRFAIEPQFELADNFSEGLADVKINGKWGYIDKIGKFVIDPQFDAAMPFSEGRAGVEIGNKWGIISKIGKYIVEPRFDEAIEFHDGLAKVKIGGKHGYIDRSGKIVIEPKFEHNLLEFSEGVAAVQAKQTSPEQTTTALGKESYEDYIDQGIIYSIAGHYDQAFAAFAKAIELDPKRAEAYYQRGLTYISKRQDDQAILDFTKVIELNPKSAEAYSFRATAYSREGKYDQAIADINKAIALDPKNARVHFNKAVVYEDMKRYTEAIEAYRMVIKYASSQDQLLIEHAKQKIADFEKQR